ncbi:hypothetical protein [Pseudomonas sp. EMN2]|uniref:hypothetical protein n=1 Tax=Pseudomonas sp. EMN2 TaxID=2615212 RepID=UPI00129B7422|nr:hypothetical protein [Pseudomonas sp. EMN2]
MTAKNPAVKPAAKKPAKKPAKPREQAQSISALKEATDALVEDKAAELIKRVDAWDMDWRIIQEETGILKNRRTYTSPAVVAHIRMLADGYKRGDRFPPFKVVVRNGVVYMRDGHCRVRAIALAESEGAVIRRHRVEQVDGDETQQLKVQLHANGGLHFTPIARGDIYAQYNAWRWSDAEIAAEFGGTPERVRQLRATVNFPLALKKLINEGYVKVTLALELFNMFGDKCVNMIQGVIDARENDMNALTSNSDSAKAAPTQQPQAALSLEPEPVESTPQVPADEQEQNSKDGAQEIEQTEALNPPRPVQRKDLIKSGAIKASLPKKVVDNMRNSFTKLTGRLDQVKVEGDKLYLPVTADELDELRALKAELDAKNLATPPTDPEQGKEAAPANADDKQLKMLEGAEAVS